MYQEETFIIQRVGMSKYISGCKKGKYNDFLETSIILMDSFIHSTDVF